jgi:hypothetical protein
MLISNLQAIFKAIYIYVCKFWQKKLELDNLELGLKMYRLKFNFVFKLFATIYFAQDGSGHVRRFHAF